MACIETVAHVGRAYAYAIEYGDLTDLTHSEVCALDAFKQRYGWLYVGDDVGIGICAISGQQDSLVEVLADVSARP